MADRRKSQIESVKKAKKKARIAARVKSESKRVKEDLAKRKAPKPFGRAKFRAGAKIIEVAEDVKTRTQIMKEKLKIKKRKK